MRHLFIGCSLVTIVLNLPSFCQMPMHHDWFNKTLLEKEDEKNTNTQTRGKAEDRCDQAKDQFDELKKDMRQIKEKVNQRREETRQQRNQRVEEYLHQIEERRNKVEQEHQDFKERWQVNRKKSKEFFDQKEKEFDQVHKRLAEDFPMLEQEEAEKVKEVIISQCGIKPQSNKTLGSRGQCSSDLSHDFSLDSQVLAFMSFSIPDSAWISLSHELERIGGIFVLRGLPNQSFQVLAHHILRLKELGVNAPIQLDPQSFLKFQIDQVPAIVAVEGPIFDKIVGQVSLEFALKKMAEQGETEIAKRLHPLLKDRI